MTTEMEEAERALYIPTEIIYIILSQVDELPEADQVLATCCLVCKEWCSIATPLLYQRPTIVSRNFASFAAAIAPSDSRRRQSWTLGQHVRELDLGDLVHHSSNSLTARILRSTKEALEIFVAPAYSMSSINLLSVSKCSKLRRLDLSCVLAKLEFDEIKASIKNLTSLKALRLPRETSLTITANHIPWPPNLRNFQFGGEDPAYITSFADSFSWPEKLNFLIIDGCKNLSAETVPVVFGNPHIQRNLRRLRIVNDFIDYYFMSNLFQFIPNVVFLSMSGLIASLVGVRFLEELDMQLNLEELEFLPSDYPWCLPIDTLLSAIDKSLHKVRCMIFSERDWKMHYSPSARSDEGQRLRQALYVNAERAGYDKTKIERGETLVGVYTFDS